MERSPALVSSLVLPFLLPLLLAPASAQECPSGQTPCNPGQYGPGGCYDPAQQHCTQGALCYNNELFNSEALACFVAPLCGGVMYDPKKQACFVGAYRSVLCPLGSAICVVRNATGGYNPTCFNPVTQGCSKQEAVICEVSMFDKASGLCMAMCGSMKYYPIKSVCIDGVVCPKGWLLDSSGQCFMAPLCGGVPYDPTRQVCFGAVLCGSDQLLNSTTGECFNAPLCANVSYDPQKQVCYNDTICLVGELLDAPGGKCFPAPLCGLVTYDPFLKVCFGTVLCDKGQILDAAGECFNPPLCGEVPYDPNVKVCLSGVLCDQGQLLNNATSECYNTSLCGSVVFDPLNEQCFDNGTVCAANASWCPSTPPTPGSCYDSATEECFAGVVCPKGQLLDPLSHECADSAVCSGIVYDIGTQVCRNGTICASGEEVCSGVCFNPTSQRCLEDSVICQLDQQLCFSNCFSVATHVCLSSGLCARDKLCSGPEGEGCMTNMHAQVCLSGRICRRNQELCPAAGPNPATGDPGGPGGCLPGNFRCNHGRVCNPGRKTLCDEPAQLLL